jgi:hypothetical protein
VAHRKLSQQHVPQHREHAPRGLGLSLPAMAPSGLMVGVPVPGVEGYANASPTHPLDTLDERCRGLVSRARSRGGGDSETRIGPSQQHVLWSWPRGSVVRVDEEWRRSVEGDEGTALTVIGRAGVCMMTASRRRRAG